MNIESIKTRLSEGFIILLPFIMPTLLTYWLYKSEGTGGLVGGFAFIIFIIPSLLLAIYWSNKILVIYWSKKILVKDTINEPPMTKTERRQKRTLKILSFITILLTGWPVFFVIVMIPDIVYIITYGKSFDILGDKNIGVAILIISMFSLSVYNLFRGWKVSIDTQLWDMLLALQAGSVIFALLLIY